MAGGLIGSFPGDPLLTYSSSAGLQVGVPVFNPATKNFMVFVKATGATFSGGDWVACTGSNRYVGVVEITGTSTIPQTNIAGVRPTGAAAMPSGDYGYIIVLGPASATKVLTGTTITAAEALLMASTAAGKLNIFT